MLSKVNKSNYFLGTEQIKNYVNKNPDNFVLIQDNLVDSLTIKKENKVFLYNYKTNKFYNYCKIKIYFTYKNIDYIFSKSIDSFDQNNVKIASKIRKYVVSSIKSIQYTNQINTILGIGGEYYIYFPFINAKYYIGMSNHSSIVDDAMYNIWCSVNYLVDYNNLETYPHLDLGKTISNEIKIINICIINVYNIHTNIIKYINEIKLDFVIIITCNLEEKRLKMLLSTFTLKDIKTFENITGYVKVLVLEKGN